MSEKPFCGYPYGFHEFGNLPEMPEDDCCVHCGKPKHEIERLNLKGSSVIVLNGIKTNIQITRGSAQLVGGHIKYH